MFIRLGIKEEEEEKSCLWEGRDWIFKIWIGRVFLGEAMFKI